MSGIFLLEETQVKVGNEVQGLFDWCLRRILTSYSLMSSYYASVTLRTTASQLGELNEISVQCLLYIYCYSLTNSLSRIAVLNLWVKTLCGVE